MQKETTMAAKTITVQGKKYDVDALSKPAQQQLLNLQVADAEIKRLKVSLAMVQTARNAYAQALRVELERV